MSFAPALPLPLPFVPPSPGWGLLGGGTLQRLTTVQIIEYLVNVIRVTPGQFWPKPPGLSNPYVASGAALVVLEALFPARLADGTLPFDWTKPLDPGLNPAPLPPDTPIQYDFPLPSNDTGAPVRIELTVWQTSSGYKFWTNPDEKTTVPGTAYEETYTKQTWDVFKWKAQPITQTKYMAEGETTFGWPSAIRKNGENSDARWEDIGSAPIDWYDYSHNSSGQTFTETLTKAKFNGVDQDFPNPDPQRPAPTQPRPTPIPINPIPPVPAPPTTAAPDYPAAAPGTSPIQGPGVPVASAPAPSSPLPLPVGPAPFPVPQPLPGVAPLPTPAPAPAPIPAPLPATSPAPIPLPIPSTPLPAVPAPVTPPNTLPVLPGTGVAPAPSPPVPITPPTVHFPVPGQPGIDTGGARPDIGSIAGELARVEGKSAAMMNGQNNILQGLGDLADIIELIQFLKELFEQPLPGKEYRITGVCEPTTEDNPNQPSTSVILPPEMWADRLISLGDMMPDLLQAHLGYRTPICASTKPTLSGRWVSTRWVSDSNSPYGRDRIRKQFRYRSGSGRSVEELEQYWRGFTWEAGATIVQHSGESWGTPQVWAATADEGKRFIRFAAEEAGIDPDSDKSKWHVGSTGNSRYGVSGFMRLQRTNGCNWVTSRPGPSALPELHPDP